MAGDARRQTEVVQRDIPVAFAHVARSHEKFLLGFATA
jgi:hypothetical protein